MKSNITRLMLLLVALVTGTAAAEAQTYKLGPSNPGTIYLSPGTEAQDVAINVTNWGNDAVSNFAYTLYNTSTKESEAEKTYTLGTPLESGETATVQIPVKPGTKAGTADVIFTITKVNGTYNQTSVPYTYLSVNTVRTKPVKRVVVEEWTGMWCQYCTKGLVIMQVLNRLYGDRFVGVAVHDGDKLATSAYEGMKSTYGTSFPSLWVARKNKTVDVLDYSVFENELKVMPMANIDVKARWDADRNNISVTSNVLPIVGVTTKYAVAYVLVADGLQHSSFTQKNNYDWYGMENLPPEADPFTSGDDITGQRYDEVAVASLGIKSGIEGSLTSPLEADVSQTHTATFENIGQYAIVSNYSLVKDRSNLRVVALLINTESNEVVNAAQCTIDDYTPTFPISFEKSPWITLYTDRAYRLPEGIEAYQVNDDGSLVTVSNGKSSDVSIAAGSALLLHAAQGTTATAAYVSEANTTPEGCLKGSMFDVTTSGSADDNYFYKLTLNSEGKNLGFYWGAADGEPFTSAGGRCYLVLPRAKVTASNFRGFALETDGGATGISGITSDGPQTEAVYDLGGRRVKGAETRGAYIVNGNKIIKK